MGIPAGLPALSLDLPSRPTVADTVFDHLHRLILSLAMPPGTRLSEAEVAAQLGTSRQPVRDAFYRLSKLGFLTIRPQRATTVSHISEAMVMQARFVRAAIEAETMRAACERLTEADLAALDDLLEAQRHAVDDPMRFHQLDDRFHREICERAGHGYVWETIRENKAHMDRVRFLSLAFASRDAFEEHLQIMAALRARDADGAARELHSHLARIKTQIGRIRAGNPAFFADAPADA